MAEVQDTPASVLVRVPGAVAWTDQEVPFHRSASAYLPVGRWRLPTRVQALGEVQDTPLNCASVTLGVCWIDHVVPFQTSATDWSLVGEVARPTAMQNVAEVQETPASELSVAPGGLGVFKTDQAVPFHDSASVTPAPVRSCRPPMAMHAVAEVHDTAVS
jgi:hypothetical protein